MAVLDEIILRNSSWHEFRLLDFMFTPELFWVSGRMRRWPKNILEMVEITPLTRYSWSYSIVCLIKAETDKVSDGSLRGPQKQRFDQKHEAQKKFPRWWSHQLRNSQNVDKTKQSWMFQKLLLSMISSKTAALLTSQNCDLKKYQVCFWTFD